MTRRRTTATVIQRRRTLGSRMVTPFGAARVPTLPENDHEDRPPGDERDSRQHLPHCPGDRASYLIVFYDACDVRPLATATCRVRLRLGGRIGGTTRTRRVTHRSRQGRPAPRAT